MSYKSNYTSSYDGILLENSCSNVIKEDSWTEISIPEMLKIPLLKPDIKNIENVIVTPQITSKRIIKIPAPGETNNQDGIRSTNKKLVVDGVLFQKIIYTSNEPTQTLITVNFDTPFSTYIVIEADTSVSESKFSVNVYVEDVVIQMIDTRNIFKNVTLFLKAVDLCTNI